MVQAGNGSASQLRRMESALTFGAGAGAGAGAGNYNRWVLFVCLQVDGPRTGGFIGERGQINGSLQYITIPKSNLVLT